MGDLRFYAGGLNQIWGVGNGESIRVFAEESAINYQ